ncbi:MAG: dephospho-CoA kinase [Oligoflexus sp.]
MDIETLQKRYGIALTGGIACGKSTVAKIIRQQNFLVLDADQLARELTEAGSQAMATIAEVFGSSYVNADGSLDRAKMRELIFRDPKQRARLEAIIHPQLKHQASIHLQKHGYLQHPQHWFYEASLIFEKQLEAQFFQVWCAYCSLDEQIKRLMARDGSTTEQAQLAIQSQMPAIEKANRADVLIDTNCPLSELETRVKQALAGLGRGEL